MTTATCVKCGKDLRREPSSATLLGQCNACCQAELDQRLPARPLMTKAIIHHDELYMALVRRDEPPLEEGQPQYYMPVEVPEEKMAEYDAAWEAFNRIRRDIVDTYGSSTTNPNYQQEWDAFIASGREIDPQPAQAAWAEYVEDA